MQADNIIVVVQVNGSRVPGTGIDVNQELVDVFYADSAGIRHCSGKVPIQDFAGCDSSGPSVFADGDGGSDCYESFWYSESLAVAVGKYHAFPVVRYHAREGFGNCSVYQVVSEFIVRNPALESSDFICESASVGRRWLDYAVTLERSLASEGRHIGEDVIVGEKDRLIRIDVLHDGSESSCGYSVMRSTDASAKRAIS